MVKIIEIFDGNKFYISTTFWAKTQ